jgi:hypothetical protein
MYGCIRGVGVGFHLGLFFLTLGCGSPRAEPPQHKDSAPWQTQNSFNRKTAGTICGQVTWTGNIPAVASFKVRTNWPLGTIGPPGLVRENPNAPRIDPQSRGVQGAVLYLRGVDLKCARPWTHHPVRIEQRDRQFHIYQGDSDSKIGFVARGAAVEMVSQDPLFHSLHAGGAVFFTLAFPDPKQPCARRLPDKGLVELTSAAGYYWMRGYLFVDDHPYYVRTDAQGRFSLPQVPPGRYELVCWLPNWNIDRQERDPESGLVTRIFFAPPLEIVKPVTLKVRGKKVVNFTLDRQAFAQICVAATR